MELTLENGERDCFRNTQLIGAVLKFAQNRGITPEFTRAMLAYGQYRIPRVYIHTLGRFYLAPANDRERSVKIRTRKAKELLAYLLEHRNGVVRGRIFADLWGESEADVANIFHTRRGEIRRVFKNLGAGNPILHENGVYHLDMDEIVTDRDSFCEATAAFWQDAIYLDLMYDFNLTVKKFNGTNWTTVGSSYIANVRVDYTSIAIDKDGIPYVVYREELTNKDLTVMKYDGTKWTTVGNPGFSGPQAMYPSIVIDGNNTPYVAYRDGSYDNKATVMKFAR